MNNHQQALYDYLTHLHAAPRDMTPAAHAMYERQLRERLVHTVFRNPDGVTLLQAEANTLLGFARKAS